MPLSAYEMPRQWTEGDEILPGTVVGGYEVIGWLGSGGMGRVYRVRHLLSKRIEAMKLVLPDVERNGFVERFQREIEVQARLSHSNICALHTAVRIGSRLALIMELAEGEPLTEELKSGPLEPRRAVEYACQLLEALGHAHERGVIHRDVKPGNIVITAGGQAKLVDFGIARLTGSAEITMEGITVGSPYYMSPEVITGRQPDPRSDIYAAGVTLYEMVTGIRPFVAETPFAILERHLKVQPIAPHVIDPLIPKSLSDAVLKALAKDPGQRFQTAGEFLAALRPAPMPAIAVRRRRTMAPLVLLTGTMALALAAWLASRPARAPRTLAIPPVAAPLATSVQTPPDIRADKPTQSPLATVPGPKKYLATPTVGPAKPTPQVDEAGMESWGNVSWTAENGWYVRGGGSPALYPRPPMGSFVFTIHRRKGNARWLLRWRNARDYLLFEVDNHAFHRKQVRDGTTLELATARRKSFEKVLTLRIDVSKTAITHSIWSNGSWTVLDDWHDGAADFSEGQFGFWPAGADEIGMSNFKFTPKTAAGRREEKP